MSETTPKAVQAVSVEGLLTALQNAERLADREGHGIYADPVFVRFGGELYALADVRSARIKATGEPDRLFVELTAGESDRPFIELTAGDVPVLSLAEGSAAARRKGRTGQIHERHPTIEQAIGCVRGIRRGDDAVAVERERAAKITERLVEETIWVHGGQEYLPDVDEVRRLAREAADKIRGGG